MALPAVTANQRESYGPDSLNFGDVYLPSGPGPHPAVVLIHGGCWRARHDLTHLGPLAAEIAKLGAVVWSLEYRRLGNPGGGWPGTFHDVAAGADHLRQMAGKYSVDLNRVIAVGHSAGGHLALWLGGRPRLPADSVLHAKDPVRLRGVVSLAGIPDLARAGAQQICATSAIDLMGGKPEVVAERYQQGSPSALLPLGVTQWLINGARDEVVPLAYLQEYETAARRSGDEVRVSVLPDAGHFELISPVSIAWPTVRDAIIELLGLPDVK